MARQLKYKERTGLSYWLIPRFDPVIHFGHVVTLAGFILAGLGAWYGLVNRVTSLDTRVSSVEKSLSQLADAMKVLVDKAVVDARQDEKLFAIDRRVDGNDRRLDRLEFSNRNDQEKSPAKK